MTHRLLATTWVDIMRHVYPSRVFGESHYWATRTDRRYFFPYRSLLDSDNTTALLWRPGVRVPCLFLLN